jgi:hypothetical protein
MYFLCFYSFQIIYVHHRYCYYIIIKLEINNNVKLISNLFNIL